MDPFLEHPDHFADFHFAFINRLRDMIQPQLPSNYYAAAQTRAWLEIAERPIVPDADIRWKKLPRKRKTPPPRDSRGRQAVVIQVPEPKRITVAVEEHQEHYVDIFSRKRGSGDQLITTIEVLSGTNKIPGSDSRKLYLEKQHDLMYGKVNLVEIDLLRGGEHTTCVPKAVLIQQAWPFDYHVCVHKFEKLGGFLIYAFSLAASLPPIHIPLLPGDNEIAVDLQKVFRVAYAKAAFERRVDYQHVFSLTPPLQPEPLEWAVALLRKRRLIPKR
jgi:hypothetical protein